VIERLYVIDMAVRNIHDAADTFGRILGIEPVRMIPEQDPTGELDAFHFPVGGLNALGLMTVKGEPDAHNQRNYFSRYLATIGEGIALLGHLVDNVDDQSNELAGRGVPMVVPEPVPYADGRLIETAPIHGAVFEFGQHHGEQVSDLWRGRRAKAEGSAKVLKAYYVDLVVDDMKQAATDVSTIYAIDPIDPPELPEADDSVDGLDFAIGGLYAVGLRSPRHGASGPAGRRLRDFLDAHGEGSSTIGFVVHDLDQTQSDVEALGIDFVYDKPVPSAVGRLNITAPVHGVRLQFAEHAPDVATHWA
jgi:hypothetical protein